MIIVIKASETRNNVDVNWFFPTKEQAEITANLSHFFNVQFTADNLTRTIEVHFDNIQLFEAYHKDPTILTLLTEKHLYNAKNQISSSATLQYI